MKKLLSNIVLVIMFLFAGFSASASSLMYIQADGNTVLDSAEVAPSFPGGPEALEKWISKNLRYPNEERLSGVGGEVVVSFIVEKDGSIRMPKVEKGVSAALNNEAIRLVKSMPYWKAGKQGGKKVRVRSKVSVMFGRKPGRGLMNVVPRGSVMRNNGGGNVPMQKIAATELKIQQTETVSDSLKSRLSESELDSIKNEDKGEIYENFEIMPSFPGGDEAMLQFIRDNQKYPTEAQNEGIQGRVLVQFVVDKDGSITDVEVFRGVHPLLDAEAIRVVKSMPKWKPGMQKGKPVRMKYTLVQMFRLQ